MVGIFLGTVDFILTQLLNYNNRKMIANLLWTTKKTNDQNIKSNGRTCESRYSATDDVVQTPYRLFPKKNLPKKKLLNKYEAPKPEEELEAPKKSEGEVSSKPNRKWFYRSRKKKQG